MKHGVAIRRGDDRVRFRRLEESNAASHLLQEGAQDRAALRRRHLDEPWPQGESWREAVARVSGCLAQLPGSHDGKRVLVIGHIATRWALDHLLNGVPLEELAVEPFAWREGWEYVLDEKMG